MKKLLLIVALFAIGYGLKAQTLVKPLDSTLLKPDLFKQLKPNDSPLMKQYFNMPPMQKATPLIAMVKPIAVPFASRMPLLKVTSDDKMPIAKVGNVERMPVVIVKPIDPLKPVTP